MYDLSACLLNQHVSLGQWPNMGSKHAYGALEVRSKCACGACLGMPAVCLHASGRICLFRSHGHTTGPPQAGMMHTSRTPRAHNMAYYVGQAIVYVGALGLALWLILQGIKGATAAIRWYKRR